MAVSVQERINGSRVTRTAVNPSWRLKERVLQFAVQIPPGKNSLSKKEIIITIIIITAAAAQRGVRMHGAGLRSILCKHNTKRSATWLFLSRKSRKSRNPAGILGEQ